MYACLKMLLYNIVLCTVNIDNEINLNNLKKMQATERKVRAFPPRD